MKLQSSVACSSNWDDEIRQVLGTSAEFFESARRVWVARAPGRLDVMGGFADYSGSLTLEMPIREAAYVAVQTSDEPVVRVQSVSSGVDAGLLRCATFPLAPLREHTSSYTGARAYFSREPKDAWVAYVLGALAALRVENARAVPSGLRILVASSVPEGKGVSSSAAVEVASHRALSALYGLEIDAALAALTCQRIENLVVGAPCGVMDQMTSSCGAEGQLLALVCQPAELLGCLPVPPGFAFWGVDSGVRHQVSGADYGSVRVAAFMGYRIIAARRGLSIVNLEAGRVEIDDEQHRGYLANLSPAELEREYSTLLPERLGGADFLRAFHGITDPITRVRPETSYRVRAATRHPILENQRARDFRDLLAAATLRPERSDELGASLGELMYAAHASYTACGLGSTGTDAIVESVRNLGAGRGLYGAKITGGGSGGTVAILARANATDAVLQVAREYAGATGHTPHVFSGSSPGAAAFGVREARLEASGWRLAPQIG